MPVSSATFTPAFGFRRHALPIPRTGAAAAFSVAWPASALADAVHEVRHAKTKATKRNGSPFLASGDTRWECQLPEDVAWIEWDWTETGEGAVAHLEPLSVRSNVLLLDDRGRPMLSSRRRSALSALVYHLPWQGPVLDELRRQSTQGSHAGRLAFAEA